MFDEEPDGDPHGECALEIKTLQARIAELEAALEAFKKHHDTLTHQVICCGVAATHPDAALTTRGAYANKWNSRQAEAVRKLRAERDALKVDAERWQRWLPWMNSLNKLPFNLAKELKAISEAAMNQPKESGQ